MDVEDGGNGGGHLGERLWWWALRSKVIARVALVSQRGGLTWWSLFNLTQTLSSNENMKLNPCGSMKNEKGLTYQEYDSPRPLLAVQVHVV